MNKDELKKIRNQRLHPEGVTYDIKIPEGTLYDANSWGRDMGNFGSPLSFAGIASFDGGRSSLGERSYSGNGTFNLVKGEYNVDRALGSQNGKDMVGLTLGLKAEADIGRLGSISISIDLSSQYPEFSISSGFFSLNSDGTTSFNGTLNLNKAVGIDLQINSNGNIYVGATILTVWAIGVTINTEVMVERYKNEMLELYNTEFGRWYDQGINNIYNLQSVHMSQMP